MAIQISGSTIIDNSRNIVNAGIATATVFDGFVPADQKLVNINLTVNNGQENISFAKDLVVDTGSVFTVSAGTTVRMNALDAINASVISASVDLDLPSGTTAQRPSAPVTGSFRYSTTYGILEFYDGTNWRGVILTDALFPSSVSIGLFGAGFAPSVSSSVDFINIQTTGNGASFGNLVTARSALAACSSSTRGVFGGGNIPAAPSPIATTLNIIDSNILAARSSANAFGNLSTSRSYLSSCSSSTRGVFGGGGSNTSGSQTNVIDYITIGSAGDALDFGDLTQARAGIAACSSSTRGVFGGGYSSVPFPASFSNFNTLDYANLASLGNASSFGSLIQPRYNLAACSSSTRGVFGGGIAPAPLSSVNTIDYITIASTGTAIDFGDLTIVRSNLAACSSSTRGVFSSGATMDYITIATTGNAISFGNLSSSRTQLAACSNAHGGLS